MAPVGVFSCSTGQWFLFFFFFWNVESKGSQFTTTSSNLTIYQSCCLRKSPDIKDILPNVQCRAESSWNRSVSIPFSQYHDCLDQPAAGCGTGRGNKCVVRDTQLPALHLDWCKLHPLQEDVMHNSIITIPWLVMPANVVECDENQLTLQKTWYYQFNFRPKRLNFWYG